MLQGRKNNSAIIVILLFGLFSFLLDNVTSLGLVFFFNCTELFNSVQLKPSGKGQNTPATIRYLKHRSKYVLYGALLK